MKVRQEGTLIPEDWSMRGIQEVRRSLLWKHCTILHGSRKTKFRMEAPRSFRYPLVRKVNESHGETSHEGRIW